MTRAAAWHDRAADRACEFPGSADSWPWPARSTHQIFLVRLCTRASDNVLRAARRLL